MAVRGLVARRLLTAVVAGLGLFVCCLPATAAERGKVVEVVDGDTLRVQTRGEVRTVRLIGIDAPERGHPAKPREFLADEAAAFLSSLCQGKDVLMEADAEDADRHGRLLRYVSLPRPSGRLLNIEMVRAGMARVYRRFSFSRLPAFSDAEREARAAGKGLWEDGGLAELRWLRAGKTTPVEVFPASGGTYAVALQGWGKTGIDRADIPKEIEGLLRLRAERSESEFGDEAAARGFRPLAPGRARPSVSNPAARPSAVVPWETAHDHIGREIVVEGTIARVHKGQKVLYLNFHPNWKRYVTIVIFARDLPRFPKDPGEHYKGRRVRVRGEVTVYKDRPEMIVRSPEAISVVKE